MDRLVIFDWDGTLADSLDQVAAAVAAAIADAGLPARAPAAIRDVIGLGMEAGVARLYPDDPAGALAALAASEARSGEGDRLRQPAPLFPGAAELLQRLTGAGLALAVATAKRRSALEREVDAAGVRHCFAAWHSGDEAAAKPDPAVVARLLAQTGRKPHEAVVVGDTLYDLQMAAAAGVDAIGVTWGGHSAERLAQAAPWALVDDIDTLHGLLAGDHR